MTKKTTEYWVQRKQDANWVDWVRSFSEQKVVKESETMNRIPKFRYQKKKPKFRPISRVTMITVKEVVL